MPLIPWYYKALAGLALVGLVLAGTYRAGYSRATEKYTLAEAIRTAQVEREHSQAILTLRAKENAAQARADASVSLYAAQKEKYTNENAALLSRVRSAEYRLRLSASPVQGCAPTGASEAVPGTDAAGACELSAGATQSLFVIAERADACALKLNALQDYVRGLME